MKYLLLFIIVLIPGMLLLYTCRFLDHKKAEPKRAILFTLAFSGIIYFIEFFLVKPAIGKFFSFYDPYFFVYFLTEEPEHLATLSAQQRLLVLFFSALGKGLAYGIGLKVLFTYLYRLGRWKFFAGKHASAHGLLDEPVDYFVYALTFFTGLALWDNLVHFRLGSGLSADRMMAFLVLFSYLVMAVVCGFLWVHAKIINPVALDMPTWIKPFRSRSKTGMRRYLFGFITGIELRTILCLTLLLMGVKYAVNSANLALPAAIIVMAAIGLGYLFRKIRVLAGHHFEIYEEGTSQMKDVITLI